jgi:hypothetical protein
MPGTDTAVLLATETVRRILCDCDLTTVITRRLSLLDPDACEKSFAKLLLEAALEVLYVGRDERTVTPRVRRALGARDRHCVFPGCRAHVRRCNAHHVIEWEHGGRTDLDNLVLLCVRHHHAVHEGGWTITRAVGIAPGGTGCWKFTPPERRHRPGPPGRTTRHRPVARAQCCRGVLSRRAVAACCRADVPRLVPGLTKHARERPDRGALHRIPDCRTGSIALVHIRAARQAAQGTTSS